MSINKTNQQIITNPNLNPNKHKQIRPIKILNHTPNTFCQGLVYYDNILYESSGLFGSSFIQKYVEPNKVI
jgi:glutamine cyclotransferase